MNAANANKNQVWTQDEEKRFVKGLAEGQPMANLAAAHGRSPNAMELRLKKIIYDNISSGKNDKALAQLLRLPSDRVTQYYYEYKGFIEKKNGAVSAMPVAQPIQMAQPIQTNQQVEIAQPVNNIRTLRAANVGQGMHTQPVNNMNVQHNTMPQSVPTNVFLNHNTPHTGGVVLPPVQHVDMQNIRPIVGGAIDEQKVNTKIKKIERENKIMKEVVENVELRKRINKMVKDGTLDKKVIKYMRRIIV